MSKEILGELQKSEVIQRLYELKAHYPRIEVSSNIKSLAYAELKFLLDVCVSDIRRQNSREKMKHLFEQITICIERVYVVVMEKSYMKGILDNNDSLSEKQMRNNTLRLIDNFKHDFGIYLQNKVISMETQDLYIRIIKGCDIFIGALQSDINCDIDDYCHTFMLFPKL